MAKKKKSEETQIPELVVDKNPITLLPLKCRNQKQKHFISEIKNHDITICDGIAGSGKTYIALYEGLLGVITKQYDKVILCKSVISTPNEDIGFIPGTVEEKMELQKKMYEAVSPSMRDFILKMCRDGKIIVNEELRELNRELKYQGNNLNQLTRLAHQNRFSSADLSQLLSVYRKILVALGGQNHGGR